MPFDRDGNWDYGVEALERSFRPRFAGRVGAFLARSGRALGILILLGLMLGGVIGLGWASWYLVGRAVGAGMRDSSRSR